MASYQRLAKSDATVMVTKPDKQLVLGQLPPGLAAASGLPPGLLTRLLACLQYGFVSVAITLFNRAVFSV